MSKFADLVRTSNSSLVRLTHSKTYEGEAVWHIVHLDKLKVAMYEKMLESGHMDFTKVGKVLYKGWGEKPPQEILDKVKEDYS